MNTITNFDFSILNWIHEHITCSFLDFIMPKITLLGNGGAIWIASAVIMLFFRKSRKTGIMLGSGLCSGVLIGNILLKNLVARDRPCWINKSIQLLISVPQDYSFPSGHTMSSFIAATIIMHFNKKLGAGFFGGEGFIMQRLSGSGTAFAEIDGELVEYTLAPGQKLIVDTGNVAGFDPGVSIDIQQVPGIKNKLFGGEGLFNTVVTGPGKILLQTMPVSGVAAALAPFFNTGSK